MAPPSRASSRPFSTRPSWTPASARAPASLSRASARWRLPGPTDITDPAARSLLAGVWKEEPPVSKGMRLLEMIEAARSGRLKALIVIGENPVRSLPASLKAAEALEKLELLVVQELFLTETAKLANVVLPACSYAE